MGFLDHSTNNIVIDAVLTDEGRHVLATNPGAFNLAYFCLGDDEVDYTLIQKFGRAVGKEKITKNTPVFEAFTKADIALKYKMITSAVTLTHMPQLVLVTAGNQALADTTGDGVGDTLQFTLGGAAVKQVTVQQRIGNTNALPDPALVDDEFVVYVPRRFLTLQNATPTFQSGEGHKGYVAGDNIDTYYLESGGFGGIGETDGGGGRVNLNLQRQAGLSIQDFSLYANSIDRSSITTRVTVIGVSSGARIEIPVKITNNAG